LQQKAMTMQARAPVRGASLADQVLEILAERIRSGDYPPESQLPPEHDLAAEFNVSRATVRTAISTLAAQGLVMRRQGVGTFVSHLSGLANPLNEAVDFGTLITRSGCEAGVRLVEAELLPPDAAQAAALDVDPAQRILQTHKVFTADGQPVIYSITCVPGWLLDRDFTGRPAEYPGLTKPLYEFLEQHCGQRVEYHVARIRAEQAGDCAFHGGLPCPDSAPVLVITETGYNADGRPLFHSVQYFPGDTMTFEVIRRRGPVG
jgi:GntR family transcriptional regulator